MHLYYHRLFKFKRQLSVFLFMERNSFSSSASGRCSQVKMMSDAKEKKKTNNIYLKLFILFFQEKTKLFSLFIPLSFLKTLCREHKSHDTIFVYLPGIFYAIIFPNEF